jgi:hypothetical protein
LQRQFPRHRSTPDGGRRRRVWSNQLVFERRWRGRRVVFVLIEQLQFVFEQLQFVFEQLQFVFEQLQSVFEQLQQL